MAVFGDMGAFQHFSRFLHVTLFWSCFGTGTVVGTAVETAVGTAVATTSGWESSVERPMIITAHGLEKTDRGSQGWPDEGSQCWSMLKQYSLSWLHWIICISLINVINSLISIVLLNRLINAGIWLSALVSATKSERIEWWPQEVVRQGESCHLGEVEGWKIHWSLECLECLECLE